MMRSMIGWWERHGAVVSAAAVSKCAAGIALGVIVGTASGQESTTSILKKKAGGTPTALEPDRLPRGDESGKAGSVEVGPQLEPQPCSFQQITPGETPVDEVVQRLGTPREDSEADGVRTLVYQVDPFEKVEFVAEEEIVVSIVLYLRDAASPSQIERELELQPSWAADVRGNEGQLLGRAYPERGVLLNFAADVKANRAVQVVLEPIAAEPFLLRVQQDRGHQFARNVRDLQTALKLDASNPEIAEELAIQQTRSGEPQAALEVVEEALQLVPGHARLGLLRAELYERLDRLDESQEQLTVILQGQEDPLLKARAEKLQGDLLAEGSARDFARAVEHHLAAVKLAAPLATDKRRETRLAAKELLVELFLAAAVDIAAGDWQDKEATTGKWLASARELANSLMSQDQADEWSRLRVTLGTLAAYAELGSTTSPEALISSINRDVQKINDASGDDWCRRELDLCKVRALFDAASIAHRREKPGQARDYAIQAISLFERLDAPRVLDPREKYLLGRLYFFAGSAVAVSAKNHEEAIKHYAKARRYLTADPPAFAALDLARQGERFVSMGASYFEAGEQELGLKLTQEGLETMKEAADAGLTDDQALSLPYNNLAAMYRAQGKTDEAKALAETAAKLAPAARGPVRR